MDQFEDEEFDEKQNENQANINQKKISLLYDKTDDTVCKIGHYIHEENYKHLSTEPCIICGHSNNNSKNAIKPNKKQILQFLTQYNTTEIPFGPSQNDKDNYQCWLDDGDAKKWPLHYAAITGDIIKIKQLCKNQNIEIDAKKPDQSNTTPITFAAEYGQLEAVIELIKQGSNLIQPPDRGNGTPYKHAVYGEHKALVVFFKRYIKYVYNVDINQDTNLECYKCYNYDEHFNKHILDGTMAKYVYCNKCAVQNVGTVQKIQQNNKIIESRIIKTLKENPFISVDTLCQMKDAKSLHTILKEIVASGKSHSYWLWLLDIDNFKSINTHLTHAIADTKIQALGETLKRFESKTWIQWTDTGYDGLYNVWAFRQGGDEFALVVECHNQTKSVLQKFYELIRNDISKIKLENMKEMKHITVSIGVCHGEAINNYEDMMKSADDAAEMIKKSGKNGIAIYHPFRKKIYKDFTEI